MKRTLPLLLCLLLTGCAAPMVGWKLAYLTVSTVLKAVDVLTPDEPEDEDDGPNNDIP